MFYKTKKGQALVEYSILLGIVLAVILIMQTFIKRHIEGAQKSAGERISEEMFSAGGTTTHQKTTLNEDQVVHEETATTNKIDDFLPAGHTATGTVDKGVYTYADRSGKMTTDTRKKIDAAVKEKFRLSEYDTTEQDNYESDDLDP